MPKIRLITEINAPIEKCFDLARSIDLHIESTKQTREQAIAGKTSGLIGLGETVTWRAKHFGIWQTLTSKITGFQPPISSSGRTTGAYFEDTMVTGAFKSFNHGHHFSPRDNKTEMLDVFIFESPLGILGRLANFLFLKRYMKKLLVERNRVIKEVAEEQLQFRLKPIILIYFIRHINVTAMNFLNYSIFYWAAQIIAVGFSQRNKNKSASGFSQTIRKGKDQK